MQNKQPTENPKATYTSPVIEKREKIERLLEQSLLTTGAMMHISPM